MIPAPPARLHETGLGDNPTEGADLLALLHSTPSNNARFASVHKLEPAKSYYGQYLSCNPPLDLRIDT